MTTEKETEFGFEDTGKKDVADKGDIKTEALTDKVKTGLKKQEIKTDLQSDAGTGPAPTGTMTKDVPQMIFRIGASLIGCPKFELTEKEAEDVATHLNILIPMQGKIVSVVFILLIVLNKVYTCMDAIKAKLGTNNDQIPDGTKAPADLPEQIG